nr:hypothetical protein [Tanacetum cinerariifolium]
MRQNTVRAYTARHGEKKHYSGSKLLCSKCNYHHDGPCAPKCYKCNRVGHLARDCRSSINANTSNIQKGTGASQKATCYECGNQGHYRKDFPKQKNQNHENQIKGTKARGVIAAVLEDKLDIRMNRFEKSLIDMKNSLITPTAPLKAVTDVCVTCGSNHSYNQCPLTRGGNDYPVFHDNIHQFQTAAV